MKTKQPNATPCSPRRVKQLIREVREGKATGTIKEWRWIAIHSHRQTWMEGSKAGFVLATLIGEGHKGKPDKKP